MFLDITDCPLMTSQEHSELCLELNESDGLGGEVDHNYYYLSNEKWIIVQSAISESELPDDFEDYSPYRARSVLSKLFYMEDGIRILPASSISGPAYCLTIPSTENGSLLNKRPEVCMVSPKQTWGKLFLPAYSF